MSPRGILLQTRRDTPVEPLAARIPKGADNKRIHRHHLSGVSRRGRAHFQPRLCQPTALGSSRRLLCSSVYRNGARLGAQKRQPRQVSNISGCFRCLVLLVFCRGENGISCWVMRPVAGEPNRCQFQWVLNTKLNGWIAQYLVDSALVGTMFDYIRDLRRRIDLLTNNGQIHTACS